MKYVPLLCAKLLSHLVKIVHVTTAWHVQIYNLIKIFPLQKKKKSSNDIYRELI